MAKSIIDSKYFRLTPSLHYVDIPCIKVAKNLPRLLGSMLEGISFKLTARLILFTSAFSLALTTAVLGEVISKVGKDSLPNIINNLVLKPLR